MNKRTVAVILFVLSCLILPFAVYANLIIFCFGGELALLILGDLVAIAAWVGSLAGLVKKEYSGAAIWSAAASVTMITIVGAVLWALSQVSWR